MQEISRETRFLNQTISRRDVLRGTATGALVLVGGASLAFLLSGCEEGEDSPESKLIISIMQKVSGQEYVDDILKGDIVVRQHLSIEQSSGTVFVVNDVHGKISEIGNFVGYDEYLLDRLNDTERQAIGQFLKESGAVRNLPMDFGDRVYTVFFDAEPGGQKGLSINLRQGIPSHYAEPPLKEYLEAARYWTDIPAIYFVSGSNAVQIAVSPIPDDAEHANMPKYGLSGSVTRELIIDVTHPKNRERLEEIAESS